jgi:uncharacterized membrane protein
MHAKSFRWAAYLLGFSFGGFFDGILLHQILQWHHLLLGVRSGALADMGAQVMADGIFHALMYVVAGIGVWLLVRSRVDLARGAAPLFFLASFLIGFGGWHVVDTVLSHWLTGIHRVRMDVDNPLFWDVLWLVIFGLVPLAVGIAMRRKGGGEGGDALAVATALPALLVAVTASAAVGASWPAPAEQASLTVVLAPGTPAGRWLRALEGSDARIVWSNETGRVWVLKPGERTSRLALYAHGAVYVSGAALPAGCSQWIRVGSRTAQAEGGAT